MLCRDVLGLSEAPLAICERICVALLASDPRIRRLSDGRWGLVPVVQGSPLLEECAFAVVDVETTGMRATGRGIGFNRNDVDRSLKLPQDRRCVGARRSVPKAAGSRLLSYEVVHTEPDKVDATP